VISGQKNLKNHVKIRLKKCERRIDNSTMENSKKITVTSYESLSPEFLKSYESMSLEFLKSYESRISKIL
jgi:uncharacterized protein (DUF2344 family)